MKLYSFVRTATIAGSLSLAAALLSTSVALADPQCHRVSAYWETNLSKLLEKIGECDKESWHKCSQASAIHHDLNAGSLYQRAQTCGLSKPLAPGVDYTSYTESDSKKCMSDRDTLREAYEVRARARIACAKARAGGSDQKSLDSQCTKFRSRMSNYHMPFRNMVQSCRINYRELVALR